MYQIPDKFKMIKSPKIAIALFKKMRWNGKIYCPYCACISGIKTHSKSKSGISRYYCPNCGHTFRDTSRTIFHKSKIPLWKWMYVIIMLFESTGSLSAAEVQRAIKVSYKTALLMLRKLRSALLDDRLRGTLKGIIESDEAWISHKKNQTILLGIVERDGSVKFFPILDRSEVSLFYPHRKFVQKGSIVCTDSYSSYGFLNCGRWTHHWVNHSIGEFVWRDISTNTIEGVWSMLKGILRTIHHGVSKKYLLEYCQLFSFMYSHRKLSFHHKFNLLFNKLCQPRYCTY